MRKLMKRLVKKIPPIKRILDERDALRAEVSYLKGLAGFQQCHICGNYFKFPSMAEVKNLRETVLCVNCGASMRFDDVAQALLKIMGSEAGCLNQAEKELSRLKIYLLESYGPLYNALSRSANLTCSEFWDDVPTGKTKGKVICEDVQRLTFPDRTFDVVISQDIFEHVPDPEAGLGEIYRVLKTGGSYIFTTPYSKSLAQSVSRAYIKDGKINHILPPVYHEDGLRSKGSLVFTDFGADLKEKLTKIGFKVEIYENYKEGYKGGVNQVFVCEKESE
jgi:SAM-dependent methyltransferase